jgi:hypothetical protein
MTLPNGTEVKTSHFKLKTGFSTKKLSPTQKAIGQLLREHLDASYAFNAIDGIRSPATILQALKFLGARRYRPKEQVHLGKEIAEHVWNFSNKFRASLKEATIVVDIETEIPNPIPWNSEEKPEAQAKMKPVDHFARSLIHAYSTAFYVPSLRYLITYKSSVKKDEISGKLTSAADAAVRALQAKQEVATPKEAFQDYIADACNCIFRPSGPKMENISSMRANIGGAAERQGAGSSGASDPTQYMSIATPKTGSGKRPSQDGSADQRRKALQSAASTSQARASATSEGP